MYPYPYIHIYDIHIFIKVQLTRDAHPLPWQLPLDLAAYPSPGMSPTLAPTWRVGRDVPWKFRTCNDGSRQGDRVPCFLGVHKWCFFGCQEKRSPDR